MYAWAMGLFGPTRIVPRTKSTRPRLKLSRSFQSETVESGDSHAFSLFLRRFAVVLTSVVLAGVGGGGGLVEPAVDWISLYR